jgi:hypothetical protein
MAGLYQLLDGSDYAVALKDDERPEATALKSTHAVDLARWQ